MGFGVNAPGPAATRDASPIWAITSYFNPAGYRRRLENYRVFRRRLAVPLVTVELYHGAEPELGEGDAEVLVRKHGGDVLWQKERLLNLALRALPADCEKVAWLDCDVVFSRPDWPQDASRLLDRVPLVQLFHERKNLPRGTLPEQETSAADDTTLNSVAYKLARRLVAPEVVGEGGAVGRWGIALGLAWAARRELLDTHHLYDAGVLGGGDRALACAAFGQMDGLRDAWHANARQLDHFRAWAIPFQDAVRGNVGCIEGAVHHLWHGDRESRRYVERYEAFRRFEFDPFLDIAIGPDGCWRWSTDKPEMHRYVSDYFHGRREDG